MAVIQIDIVNRLLIYFNVLLTGEFTVDHPTILLFWKIVQKFTDSQKRQLLKFVTSCSRAPLLGFKVSMLKLQSIT